MWTELSARRYATASRILYRSVPGKAKRGLALVLAALVAAALSSEDAIADPAIGTVVRLAGAAELTRDGAATPLGEGVLVFSGDTIETATASGLSIELADGAALLLGENARAIIRGAREGDSRGAIAVALAAGSARVERIDESAAYPIVMTGGFATARALSPQAGWIMRTGSRGTDVATILGETMVTHRYHYWRMVLGPDVGMSRIAIGDVHKFRLPKARHFSRAKLEAIFPTAEP